MSGARRLVPAALPVAMALAALLPLSACGGSAGDASPASTGTGSTAGTTTAHAGHVDGTVVAMGEYHYRPADVTVRVGEPVVFRNDGRIEHTVADAASDGTLISRRIRPRPLATGEVQRVVFRTPGRVHYVCTFHPTLMDGDITVVR